MRELGIKHNGESHATRRAASHRRLHEHAAPTQSDTTHAGDTQHWHERGYRKKPQ